MKILESSQTLLHVLKRETVPWLSVVKQRGAYIWREEHPKSWKFWQENMTYPGLASVFFLVKMDGPMGPDLPEGLGIWSFSGRLALGMPEGDHVLGPFHLQRKGGHSGIFFR